MGSGLDFHTLAENCFRLFVPGFAPTFEDVVDRGRVGEQAACKAFEGGEVRVELSEID